MIEYILMKIRVMALLSPMDAPGSGYPPNKQKITRSAYRDYFSANFFTSYYRTAHGHDFRHNSTGVRLVGEENPAFDIPDQVDFHPINPIITQPQFPSVSNSVADRLSDRYSLPHFYPEANR